MRLLLSYHFARDHDVDELMERLPANVPKFADSGAYSAKSIGADVTLDGYCDWLTRYQRHFETYVALDVIGDAVSTERNYMEMLDRGMTPIPVFHGGSSFDVLERYCERSDYVALGGMVATSGPAGIRRWLVKCFKIAREHGTVFHGFGQTNTSIVRAFPFYTVDSSSWGASYRYGMVPLWDDWHKKMRQARCGTSKVLEHSALIREHGGDPTYLATKGYGLMKVHGPVGREHNIELMRLGVTAYMRMEAWLQTHHEPVPAPTGYTEPGPHVMLAFLPEIMPLLLPAFEQAGFK